MIAQVDSLYVRTRPWKLWSRLLSYGLFEGRPLTTRGRWINPLVFGHFALEKRLPQLRAVKKPVFILGTGRSGTTVLGIVLSMHREVGYLNEPKALWHAVYPKEDLIGSYDAGEGYFRLGVQEASEDVRRTAHRLFGAYLAATLSRRVLDKYPELIFRVPFVKAIFPDAKFLVLIRNGWDTSHSIDQWSDRLGMEEGDQTLDWWGLNGRKWNLLIDQIVPEHADLAAHATAMRSWTDQRHMALVEWIVTMREATKVLRTYSDDAMRVDYEHLCAQPARVLSDITNFLELARNDAGFLEYGIRKLRPGRRRNPFVLPTAIDSPFRATMEELGYCV